MRARNPTLALVALAMLAATESAMAQEFTLSSTSVSEGSSIDRRYTCRGADVSIALAWQGAPAGTQSFAIIMDDPDAVPVAGYTWVHWNVFNIPPETGSVDEGETVAGGTPGRNHFKRAQYNGPCPPRGSHTYFVAVYALSAPFDTAPRGPVTREAFEKDHADRILAKAELSASFP